MNQVQVWNPFKELEVMQKSFSDFFDRDSAWALAQRGSGFNPAIDISEDKENLHFKMELPDVKKEDIKIDFSKGVLTISGQKKFETESKNEGKKYHRIERTFGSFMRSFSLPEYADAEKVNAEYTNGVLDVKVAKKMMTAPTTKSITIK